MFRHPSKSLEPDVWRLIHTHLHPVTIGRAQPQQPCQQPGSTALSGKQAGVWEEGVRHRGAELGGHLNLDLKFMLRHLTVSGMVKIADLQAHDTVDVMLVGWLFPTCSAVTWRSMNRASHSWLCRGSPLTVFSLSIMPAIQSFHFTSLRKIHKTTELKCHLNKKNHNKRAGVDFLLACQLIWRKRGEGVKI